MRQLVVVCEAHHAPAVHEGIARFGHPAAVQDFVTIFQVDLDGEADWSPEQRKLVSLLDTAKSVRFGITNRVLVCATKEAAKALSLGTLFRALRVEHEQCSAAALTSVAASDGRPFLQRLLNRCGLSLRASTAEILQNWTHDRLDQGSMEDWINQFGALGKFTWVAEEILRNMRLVGAVELGELLAGLAGDAAMCVNRDPRAHGKSAEVIANLLTKRVGRPVFESPAHAIDVLGHRKIVLFEDGLWSGTEAVGVLESLLGRRPPEKQKTTPLSTSASLADLDVTFAYGIATDYGLAVVRRFLGAEKMSTVKLQCGQQVSIATPALLERIESGDLPIDQLQLHGPPQELIKPQLIETLGRSNIPVGQREVAQTMCASVGQQLFDNYLKYMQQSKGWSPWPYAKRIKCALGMHGLGLMHAFGHSVPKAALPMLWSAGPVEWNGKTIDWKPLFPNA